MQIGDQQIGRVAVLVLDYDPLRDDKPSQSLTGIYDQLTQLLTTKYLPSGLGNDVTVLANEELVAKHQKDFEDIGIRFFPNWRESKEYRDMLREGLKQGTDLYLMRDIGLRGGHGSYYLAMYQLDKVTEDDLEIIDREGRIDIKPKRLV